jgi:uncharacterized protein YdeI (YjbR/CyaY-like superfamily)
VAKGRAPSAIYFESAAAFRRWLEQHHDSATELIVGFHKTHTKRPTLTWPESVDEALCFGWIDGVRRRVDEDRYTIRFTPRRRQSIWSLVNIRRVAALTKEGRMHPAGLRAFEARREDRSGVYSAEQRNVEFAPPDLKRFKANAPAWRFFAAQPPGYRKIMTHWVSSAKKAETRTSRLDLLMAHCAAGVRVDLLRPRRPLPGAGGTRRT